MSSAIQVLKYEESAAATFGGTGENAYVLAEYPSGLTSLVSEYGISAWVKKSSWSAGNYDAIMRLSNKPG